MKKRILYLIILTGLLSGCVYQRYHAQQFKPDKNNQVKACRVHSNPHTMRGYYKLR